tara:strand:- start:222 stop:542 length:321 start_codon:yes stop_codon:yes gene_type:complete
MPEESKLTEKLEEQQSEIKFTEEELKQVQDIQKTYTDTTNKFGQLSITKLRFNEQLKSLDKEHNTLIETLNKIQQDETKFLDSITKKYGQGTLDPQTGVFTANKSE